MNSWKENRHKKNYRNHNYNNSNIFYQKKAKNRYRYYKFSKPHFLEKEIDLNLKDSELDEEAREEANKEVQNSGLIYPKETFSAEIETNQENADSEKYQILPSLNLVKSQSEDTTHSSSAKLNLCDVDSKLNDFNFHDVSAKLFPGVFRDNSTDKNDNENNKYNNINDKINEKTISEKDNNNSNNSNNNHFNYKCNNFVFKNNNLSSFECKKNENKSGLALALDYYSSFLEDKNKIIVI